MKKDLKCKVCSNFQITFLHLVRWIHPVGKALGQVDFFVRSLGQADLWSDGPLVVTSYSQVCSYLSQVDLWSDIPPVVTSCGQVCSYFSQVDLWSYVPPLGEALGQVDIFVRSLGQADLWSDGLPPTGAALG